MFGLRLNSGTILSFSQAGGFANAEGWAKLGAADTANGSAGLAQCFGTTGVLGLGCLAAFATSHGALAQEIVQRGEAVNGYALLATGCDLAAGLLALLELHT